MFKLISAVVFIFVATISLLAQTDGAVTANVAKLRGSPDPKGIVIAAVRKGQIFEVITNRGTWYLVQTAKYVGWINDSAILLASNTSSGTVLHLKYDDPNENWATGDTRIGNGTGGGQGVGTGTGAGTGVGSGRGTSQGVGNGAGSGSGGGEGAPAPSQTTTQTGVTQGVRVLSKPRAAYTDAAREANIQGTVLLRVTFLASGQIGSISPVQGLPHGLTEQAIAAARNIVFEPAKRDGVAVTTTRVVTYPFVIY